MPLADRPTIETACRLWVKDGRGQLYRRPTIDVLLDDVLLEVFNFYLDGDHPSNEWPLDAWHKLVHVCRRWRQLVFASPRRLKLRLLCMCGRPVKKLLDIWPALPIVIRAYVGLSDITNIEAALEHNDRICEISIDCDPDPFLNSMKKPFPELTSLKIRSYGDNVPVPPDSFLDGSATRLRKLDLFGILFPGLPKLLLSAHNLVDLQLRAIPDSGYISPEAMVTCLSSLTNLKVLVFGFRSPQPHTDQTNRHQAPLTRTVLPSLTFLSFDGLSKYLEDIVAQVDIPLLNRAYITFSDQLISDAPPIRSFISRTEAFKALDRADILYSRSHVHVTLRQEERAQDRVLHLATSLARRESDRPLLPIARLFNWSLPPLPTLELLSICNDRWGSYWLENMEDSQWQELFHSFITVKCLYLGKKIAAYVASALQELTAERGTEVLPALQNVFVEGPVQQAFAQFITTRRLLGHPVAVHDWDGKRPQ